MGRRIFIVIAAVLCCISWGCGKPKELSQKHLRIATGSKSGIYYPVGEAIARILKEKFADVQVEVLESEGSIQNLAFLQDGKANLALVQNDIAHYALFGENMFAGKKLAGITGLATLFPEVVHIICRQSANIQGLANLSGKKVAVGPDGSGTFHNAQQILIRAKIWDQIQRVTASPTEALLEFENGTIDAVFYSSGLPNQKIANLASRTHVTFIPVEADLVQDLVNGYPFYFPSEIPEGAYPGVASSVPTIEINSLLVSNSSLNEDDHYLLTKALFSSLETLKGSHPALASITTLSLRRQMTIPLSPGANSALSE